MAFEFDHLFICTDVGAKVADRLVALGLVEGSTNVHPGQGTANRRFFFHNAMLEFLWVEEPSEAQSGAIQGSRLWERWRDRNQGVCPFGICLRPSAGETSLAFPAWQYRPPYLPTSTSIAVATNSDRLYEPMLFQLPFGHRPDCYPAARSQPLQYPLGLREISRVSVISPFARNPSPALQVALSTQQFYLHFGSAYDIVLGFDGETKGQQANFHPTLRLTLRW